MTLKEATWVSVIPNFTWLTALAATVSPSNVSWATVCSPSSKAWIGRCGIHTNQCNMALNRAVRGFKKVIDVAKSEEGSSTCQ